ncbi:MAG: tetratricopeptide repeat protein [Bacteroidota bacterium]
MPRLLPGTLLLTCLLLCSSSVLAQTNSFSSKQKEIEVAILNFKFAQARQQLSKLPSQAHRTYYELSINVYQFLATQDNRYFLQMRNKWRASEASIEALEDNNPHKRLLLAEIHCKRAAVEFLKENYFSAIQYARSGRNYAIDQSNRFPQHKEIYKVLGVFNAMFGAVPTRYLWLTEMLGYEGNVQQGLKQLSIASQSQTGFMMLEADLFASYIEKIMLNQSQVALQRLLVSRRLKGESAMLDYFCALAYMQNKQTEKALTLLQKNRPQSEEARQQMPYWEYQIGKAYYFRGDYGLAYVSFKRFLKAYQGSLFRTDACFRLGMAYTLNGNYAEGKQYFALINQESGFDQDEYAAYLAQRFEKNIPSPALQDLFKARNYYDGGYFAKAEGILQQLLLKEKSLNAEERTELQYRLGRLYHTQNQFDKAQKYYEASTLESVEEQKWLQAYAQYYLGELAYKRAQFPLARSYYQKALEYDNYWYQSGLENRCKSRLDEIKALQKNG